MELHWWMRDCWGDLVRTAETHKNGTLSSLSSSHFSDAPLLRSLSFLLAQVFVWTSSATHDERGGSKWTGSVETAGTFRTARVRSEQDCGSEAISDSITQAVIKSQRREVRTHLELQTFARTTDLVNLMSSLSKMRTAATSSSSAGRGPTPMEIGWVKGKVQAKSKNKEKGKGKGKSKGMGKEKPKSEKFEGWCNNCCKWGHKASTCWHGKEKQVH